MLPASSSRVGRYVIVDRLGHGGMGVVYRAYDPELRRVVALKMLPATSDSPFLGDLLERFAREARSAASLTHPNIITIHDVGQDAGRPFIVMEFIEGQTLAQLLRRGDPLSLDVKLRLAIELCAGLAFAHGRGIIHRDIKPANLMITGDGVLKILDFGLARLASDLTKAGLTQEGAIVGTILYMSPEQLSGQVADQRSDIFSVGTVLYELFTGVGAFDADNPAVVRMQILQDPPRRWRELSSVVPAGLEALENIVANAMEKDPSRRYQTLEDLATDLAEQARALGVDTSAGPSVRLTSDVQLPGSAELADVMKGWQRAVGDALGSSEPHSLGPPTDWPITSEVAASTVQTPPAPSSATPASRRGAESRPGVSARFASSRWPEAMAVAVAGGAIVLYLMFGRSAPSPARSAPGTSPPPGNVTSPAAQPPTVTAPSARDPAPAIPVIDDAPREVPEPGARSDGDRSTQPRPPAATSKGSTRESRSTKPSDPDVMARCDAILERIGIGEELTKVDRDFLTARCRDRQ